MEVIQVLEKFVNVIAGIIADETITRPVLLQMKLIVKVEAIKWIHHSLVLTKKIIFILTITASRRGSLGHTFRSKAGHLASF